MRHGKGDRQRIVGMDDDAFALLEIWLERRRKLGLARRPAVFCTLKGKPLSTSYIRHLLPRLANEHSFHPTSECTPTPCATTDATRAPAKGARLDVISGQLGHSSLATTHRYLNDIAPHERVKKVRQRNRWTRP